MSERGGRPRVIGKAVVFARSDVVMPDTSGWLADTTVRDVPRPGQSIRRGQPVCTVFADGSTLEACHAALVSRAAEVYTAIEATPR
jgi:predicted ATP-grasp superfamily ATP-dependent carboligase